MSEKHSPAGRAGDGPAGTPPRARLLLLAVAATAGVLLGLMARPAPGGAAATAREALTEARRQGAHRTAPVTYRRAELAYLDAGQAVARANDRWIPRYGRARALYEQAERLAAGAVAAAAARDLRRDHDAVEDLVELLEVELGEVREQLDELATRWGRTGLVPELSDRYRAGSRALAIRIDVIRDRLASGDLAEAAALGIAARAQMRVLRQDLVAWRLSMELSGE